MRAVRGLSLLEVLIVLVLVALATGWLTLGSGALAGRDDEVARLALAVETAARQADERGTPLRLELLPGSYRFAGLDSGGQWQPLREPALLAERRLPPGSAWDALEVDGRRREPPLVFAGEPPLFVLAGRIAGQSWRLAGDAGGRVRRAPEPVAAGALR